MRKRKVLLLSLMVAVGLVAVILAANARNIEEVNLDSSNICGPFVLQLAARDLGLDVSVEKIAGLAKTDETGTTMYGLCKAAKRLGFDAYGIRTDLDGLLNEEGRVIIFINDNHYVYIDEFLKSGLVYYDREEYKFLSYSEFLNEWNGVALVVKRKNWR